MSDTVTKQELQTTLQAALKTQTDEILEVINAFVGQVDERFDRLETRMDKLEVSHQRLLNTIDGFVSRIDRYETERAARDNQFEKLLVWARKVSKETGIPLENL